MNVGPFLPTFPLVLAEMKALRYQLLWMSPLPSTVLAEFAVLCLLACAVEFPPFSYACKC